MIIMIKTKKIFKKEILIKAFIKLEYEYIFKDNDMMVDKIKNFLINRDNIIKQIYILECLKINKNNYKTINVYIL